MPRKVLVLGLVILGLTFIPSVQAKEEITRLQICGASRCTTIADPAALGVLLTDIGDGSSAPSPRAPFYTMRPEKTREWPATWPHYVYVPASKMSQQHGILDAVRVTMGNAERYWDYVTLSVPILQRATRDLKPNPTPNDWSAADVVQAPATGDPNRGSPWKWLLAGGLGVIVLSLIAQRARRLRHESPTAAPGRHCRYHDAKGFGFGGMPARRPRRARVVAQLAVPQADLRDRSLGGDDEDAVTAVARERGNSRRRVDIAAEANAVASGEVELAQPRAPARAVGPDDDESRESATCDEQGARAVANGDRPAAKRKRPLVRRKRAARRGVAAYFARSSC